MEKLPVILGSIVAFVSIMTGAGWWLINQYFKKSAELEVLKEGVTTKAIQGLHEVVKEIRVEIEVLQKRMIQLEKAMISHVGKVEGLKETFEKVSGVLTKIVQFVDRKVEKSEMAQIGKDLFIMRKKRNEGET